MDSTFFGRPRPGFSLPVGKVPVSFTSVDGELHSTGLITAVLFCGAMAIGPSDLFSSRLFSESVPNDDNFENGDGDFLFSLPFESNSSGCREEDGEELVANNGLENKFGT